MGTQGFVGMQFYAVKMPSNTATTKRFQCAGRFLKVEDIPSGNKIKIKSSEGETVIAAKGRSMEFVKPFTGLEISGFAADETIVLQAGDGWMEQDPPDPTVGGVLAGELVSLPTAGGGTYDITFPGGFSGLMMYVNQSGAIDLSILGVQINQQWYETPAADFGVILFDKNKNPVANNNITAEGIYYVFTFGFTGIRLQNDSPDPPGETPIIRYGASLNPLIFPA